MRRSACIVFALAVTYAAGSACVATANEDVPPLARVAVPFNRPPGAPQQGDICFSSRWPRPESPRDPHDTFAAAKAFRATRFDWCYAPDTEYIRNVKAAGYTFFGAISSELEGGADGRGREKNAAGEIIGNPELSHMVARGDVNSDAYAQIVMRHLKRLIDGGADGVQVDDPGMTYHNTLHLGGGYGDESMKRFREYLALHSMPHQRVEWGIPEDISDFNYANYVRERSDTAPAAVRELFVAFHRESLTNFYDRIRSEIDAYAGRHVPFSCNNWSTNEQDAFPFREHFDFWVGETSLKFGPPTAKRIYEKVRNAEKLGKVQVFSPPNDGPDIIPTREAYVSITRKLIAMSYACGSATLVPWDVWRRGEGTPRFFGTIDEFGGLFNGIADNRALLDDHEEVFASGAGIEIAEGAQSNAPPVRLDGDSQSVFMSVRAVPQSGTAPIIVHFVEWADTPSSFSVLLANAEFGWPANEPIRSTLCVPGAAPNPATGTLAEPGTTVISIPALSPYGLLIVPPRPSPGSQT